MISGSLLPMPSLSVQRLTAALLLATTVYGCSATKEIDGNSSKSEDSKQETAVKKKDDAFEIFYTERASSIREKFYNSLNSGQYATPKSQFHPLIKDLHEDRIRTVAYLKFLVNKGKLSQEEWDLMNEGGVGRVVTLFKGKDEPVKSVNGLFALSHEQLIGLYPVISNGPKPLSALGSVDGDELKEKFKMAAMSLKTAAKTQRGMYETHLQLKEDGNILADPDHQLSETRKYESLLEKVENDPLYIETAYKEALERKEQAQKTEAFWSGHNERMKKIYAAGAAAADMEEERKRSKKLQKGMTKEERKLEKQRLNIKQDSLKQLYERN